jgi:2-aminoadipate transaminase
LPPLFSLDGGEYVLYLGTFSKILSPGIRLGWLVAPDPVLAKIKLGKQAADLCTSSLTQQLVDVYFEQDHWRSYIKDLSSLYRDRRDAMLDALAEFFPPEAEWTRPAGGLFIWATLPDFIDTGDLLAKAIREEQVAFVPGAAAYVDGRGGSSMRLNFSGADSDAIREGIKRIGKVVREQIALYGTVTGRTTVQASERAARPQAPGAADDEERAERLAEVVRLPQRSRERRGAKGG